MALVHLASWASSAAQPPDEANPHGPQFTAKVDLIPGPGDGRPFDVQVVAVIFSTFVVFDVGEVQPGGQATTA